MARTFFSALGLLFAALLMFSASFLGNIAADLDIRRGEYRSLAVELTRELSQTWQSASIEPYYAADAREELALLVGAYIQAVKPLGPLLHAADVNVEVRWSQTAGLLLSPDRLSERLTALLNRAVKVSFVGRFAGGLAGVTAEFKREDGRLKLWRLRIDSRQEQPAKSSPERRSISFA
ncbi:MAG: hypothetical protein WC829_12645 [Hyphomicrobium sp.]|jgi:hypothetical protein